MVYLFIVEIERNFALVLFRLMRIESDLYCRFGNRIQHSLTWVHVEYFALFHLLLVNSPGHWVCIWVRDHDVQGEGLRLLAFGNDFGLEVDYSGLQEKSRLDADCLDSPL